MLKSGCYCWRDALCIFLMLMALGGNYEAAADNDSGQGEVLAYAVWDAGKGSLFLYDVRSESHRKILSYTDFYTFPFRLSIDGRLAYEYAPDGSTDIYLLDGLSPSSIPINLTATPEVDEELGSWSSDGRYLAYMTLQNNERASISVWNGETSVEVTANEGVDAYTFAWSRDGRYLAYAPFSNEESRHVFVWDGETSIEITPHDLIQPADSYQFVWSWDGRLAFTVWYEEGDPSEIYLWNGHRTTNLSQNPTGEDSYPAWSRDGQLTFRSIWKDVYDVYVWNGVGLPG